MLDTILDSFYRYFVTDIEQGNAALFIGAGLSKSSGYVNWKELMKDVAKDLQLEIEKEHDLIALAQYHQNTRQSRHELNRLLVNEFTKDTKISQNHELIAQLPIRYIWTTNYDQLIEQAFGDARKRIDIKITPPNLAMNQSYSDAILYKMHGDIQFPDQAVLTKEDYETYDETRQLFSTLLKGDLVAKTFLFLGFSFDDPNIDYILSRIRILMGQNKRTHYCLMKKEVCPVGYDRAKYEYNCRKQELRIDDLKRYGIQAIMIDEYSEVTNILKEIHKRVCCKNVFVSGSAHNYAPLGQLRVEGLARMIGKRLIIENFNLVSGFGLGIGSAVITAAIEAIYASAGTKLEERTVLRPFPQSVPEGMSLQKMWSRYRSDMIGNAGAAIFLCGNKLDESGNVVSANGVREEYEIAIRLNKYPIPIGATGWIAKELWEEVRSKLDTLYKGVDVKIEFQVLGDESKSDAELADAVFSILHKVISGRTA